MARNPGTNRPAGGFEFLYARKWTFLALAIVIFGTTLWILDSYDLLPNSTPGAEAPAPALTNAPAAPAAPVTGELPVKITIQKINLTATVANPTTSDPNVLDQDLLYGAVRYPGSGTLGVDGQNVVLFGHSSYLPIVHNQAFKTFDGIQNLATGDRISVESAGRTYVYEVETVASASAQTDGIPLTVPGQKLTLVTCDSFKTKSDRFVVIAHLVESYPSAS